MEESVKAVEGEGEEMAQSSGTYTSWCGRDQGHLRLLTLVLQSTVRSALLHRGVKGWRTRIISFGAC